MDTTSTDESLSGTYSVPVYYEDTDFSGFVYHANHLKFMERAREHLLGIDNIKKLYQSGRHFVVRDLNIRYIRPARHGDQLTVKSRFTFNNSPRVLVEQDIYLDDQNKCSSAQLTLVFLGDGNRPTTVNKEILSQITGG